MWRITLKGLLAHRVRLVLTTLSVLLGVAFVSGTFVLTDTMAKVFDDLVRGGTSSVDVLIRSASADDVAVGTDTSYYGATTLPEALLDDVLAVDGVADAEGAVEGYALIVRPDGEPITPMGPPSLGVSWSTRGDRVVREGGRPPSGPDEVVVDATTADRHGLQVGDRVRIVFASSTPRTFTVVGTSSAEGGENLAGATLAEFEPSTAQRLLGLDGMFTGISVWAHDGVDADVLVDRLTAALPPDTQAITAADWADETMAQIEDALGFITTALGAFAAIALLVGAFIIANTFSITVVQRTREFALLRALGASRRQVVLGVVGEALVVGAAASVLGVLAGMGLAAGLQELLRAFGLDMPTGTLVLRPRTVVVGLTIGLLVTVVSALLPARRAAGVHPMAALRESRPTTYRLSTARRTWGTAVGALAAALVGVGAVAQPAGAGPVVGAGAALAAVSLAVLGPALTRPVLGVLGGSGDHFGITARVARRNSMRTPRRTWTTAAALTVGLALVSSVAVMAASMKASSSVAMDATMRADIILTAGNAMTGGTVPPVLAQRIAALPEVGAVSPFRAGTGTVAGTSASVISVDPTTWEQVGTTDVTAGSFDALSRSGTLAVDAELAELRGYAVGDRVDVVFPASGATTLELVAVFEPDGLLSGWLSSIDTSDAVFSQPLDAAVLVAAAPDHDVDSLRAAVEGVTAAYPSVTVQDQAEYRDTVAGQVDQVLALVTALLGMALFIAVLGIMNTLALSIHERTREIGLLRAVGMSRGQVRGMIRWEAVTVAALGSTTGLVFGTVIGWAITRALADEGMGTFAMPIDQLTVAVLLAILAGVLAAVLPARAAARLDVLRAVTVE